MAGLPRAWHEAQGARWDEESGAPRNYGDPAAEYAAARGAAAVIDRADRHILRVSGRDPVRMVQGLVSNDVALLGDDRAVYATVLTPKGKMVADVRIVREGDALLLETDVNAVAGLAAHLRKFVPPLFARAEDISDAMAVFSVVGPDSAGAVADVLGAPPALREDEITRGRLDGADVLMIGAAYAGEHGVDLLASQTAAKPLWEALERAGARPAGHATLDVLRIEAGRPRWARELDENTIPLEAGLRGRAISETKGCYTGQEVIIRILHRGHVNWQLRGVLLGDAAAPPRDTALHDDAGRRVGRITSAAWSPRMQQTIALAYVRREVGASAQLRIGDDATAAATVVELPFVHA